MQSTISKNNTKFIMSFGKMPLANKFLDKKDFSNEKFYDMSVGFDENLSLFQLINFPEPEDMFDENYAFLSGTSEFMKLHFEKFANQIKNLMKKSNNNKKIIEIGCNDGIMLRNFYNDKNYVHLGIEPSKNVYKIAKNQNLNVLNEFFSKQLSSQLREFEKNTDVIYAANVICHIPDLQDLFLGIENLLAKDGLFIFEEPYLGEVAKITSYDQIYDEHIYLFSLLSVEKISNMFDLQIIDAIPQLTHGGSMRYFVGRKGQHEISRNVKKFFAIELNQKLDKFETYIKFKNNCENSKKRLIELIHSHKKKGKSISGYAATSKSTTILNYCKIGNDLIDCIYDTTPLKINKFSPGMHIPIKDHKYFPKDNPDVSLLFGWNHKNEIFKKEHLYKKNGGIWISHIEDLI